MKKCLKYIKSNKTKFMLGTIIFCVLLVLFFTIKLVFFNSTGSKYGNRLDGIDKVTIENSLVEKIKKETQSKDGVESVNYDLEGRLVNILITVSKEKDRSSSMELANSLLDYFTDDMKTYYDIQVYVDSSSESDSYPIMGYKHKTSTSFVWNNF